MSRGARSTQPSARGRLSSVGRVPAVASVCVNQRGEDTAAMDEATGHEETWHEDDVLHQAEGRLAVRLGITVEEAVRVLRAHAEAEGITPRDLAPGVIDGSVHITP
jgi:hypothetical protein